jgi:hypothetical protein
VSPERAAYRRTEVERLVLIRDADGRVVARESSPSRSFDGITEDNSGESQPGAGSRIIKGDVLLHVIPLSAVSGMGLTAYVFEKIRVRSAHETAVMQEYELLDGKEDIPSSGGE